MVSRPASSCNVAAAKCRAVLGAGAGMAACVRSHAVDVGMTPPTSVVVTVAGEVDGRAESNSGAVGLQAMCVTRVVS